MQSPEVAPESTRSAPPEMLELRVAELWQLFNAMDPAPSRERDLDPDAEAYIVDGGRETGPDRSLGLVVHLSRDAATAENTALLRHAVHAYFGQRAIATRQRLRHLFRIGRVSLRIGLAFLAGAIALGEFVSDLVSNGSYGGIIEQSFVIGGWVALWRPLEIFLCDWWPIRAEARLFDRLGAMDVRLVGAAAAGRPAP